MRYQVSMEISVSDRNRALKRQSALLLAASDMDQAAAAVRALEAEQDDYNLMPALETAIAVCYARAFTQSSLFPLDRNTYEPTDPVLAELHKVLCKLRDKVYAHTDKDGGRSAAVLVRTDPVELPGRVEFLRQEDWVPMPRDSLPVALELVEIQGTRFHNEAGTLKLWVDGP